MSETEVGAVGVLLTSSDSARVLEAFNRISFTSQNSDSVDGMLASLFTSLAEYSTVMLTSIVLELKQLTHADIEELA